MKNQNSVLFLASVLRHATSLHELITSYWFGYDIYANYSFEQDASECLIALRNLHSAIEKARPLCLENQAAIQNISKLEGLLKGLFGQSVFCHASQDNLQAFKDEFQENKHSNSLTIVIAESDSFVSNRQKMFSEYSEVLLELRALCENQSSDIIEDAKETEDEMTPVQTATLTEQPEDTSPYTKKREAVSAFKKESTDSIEKKPVKNNQCADEPFIPNPTQERILNALNGEAMKAEALASAANTNIRVFWNRQGKKRKSGGGGRPRKGDLTELREQGRVKHHPRIGYYRPDAPPKNYPELKNSSTDKD